MNTNYIKLCKLLKDRGIESGSGIKVFTNLPYQSFNYTKYEISDILRKDTGITLWGDAKVCGYCGSPDVKFTRNDDYLTGEIEVFYFCNACSADLASNDMPGVHIDTLWVYQRGQILGYWDSEDSKPLEDCEKVLDYLIENIK